MNSFSLLKDKAVLIAEKDEDCLKLVDAILSGDGFKNLHYARTGHEIDETLKLFRKDPNQLGLLIVDENLPELRLQDLCAALQHSGCYGNVPFIILSDASPKANIKPLLPKHEGLMHWVGKPVKKSELLPFVNFFLALKHERDLRCEHEERLINELADRKVMEARLKYLVSHDELTGLANRRSLEQNLKLVLHRLHSFDHEGALLYLDIDRFNILNDLEGYDVGDRLLVEVVGLIRSTLRNSHYLARIGSDEFCIYLEDTPRKQAMETAERLRRSLEEYRFVTGNVCYRVSACVGIAFVGGKQKVSHPTELIAHAHQACYVAKSNGRNIVWAYNDKDATLVKRQRDIYWVPLIREALLERRFFLVFQPVVRLADGMITHYEVLLRMIGKDKEVITPDNFIPVAERMGLIHRIDLWVVESAIDFLASLPPHLSHVALTVNLSGMAFQDQSLLPLIKQKLEMTWLDAGRITFEITETSAVENYQQTREMVSKIRAMGCNFALDDFGAGFCSFNYIKNFPVDYLKIDGQFIQNLANDETDKVLVKAMNEIAHNLGKKTIAEFVETPQVLKLLKEMSVDYVQGHLLGRPSEVLSDTNAIDLSRMFATVPEAQAGIVYG